MITKQQYIDSINFELGVIRHLATKIDAAHLDFKPTPKQRSTHELMTYMSTIFGGAVDMIKASGDRSVYKAWTDKTPAVTLENFSDLLAVEEKHIAEVVGEMTEAELSEAVTIYGATRTRAEHLLNGPLKWAAAYKMQLFMNLKMSGAEHLNTLNLWAGMDGQLGA